MILLQVHRVLHQLHYPVLKQLCPRCQTSALPVATGPPTFGPSWNAFGCRLVWERTLEWKWYFRNYCGWDLLGFEPLFILIWDTRSAHIMEPCWGPCALTYRWTKTEIKTKLALTLLDKWIRFNVLPKWSEAQTLRNHSSHPVFLNKSFEVDSEATAQQSMTVFSWAAPVC